ncbi:MAG: hypothetical protein MZV63_58490 [Marinilabiliales bacterium]|nr:hypothetical protein [Marinilabiliales bacterium]
MLKSAKPVISVGAVRTGCGKSQTSRRIIEILMAQGAEGGGGAPPHALRRPCRPEGAALCQAQPTWRSTSAPSRRWRSTSRTSCAAT